MPKNGRKGRNTVAYCIVLLKRIVLNVSVSVLADRIGLKKFSVLLSRKLMGVSYKLSRSATAIDLAVL